MSYEDKRNALIEGIAELQKKLLDLDKSEHHGKKLNGFTIAYGKNGYWNAQRNKGKRLSFQKRCVLELIDKVKEQEKV